MKKAARVAFRVLSSNGLACVLLVLLMVVTFLGTIEQVDRGLYEVKKRYFESLFLIHWAFSIFPIPLPGGYLLATLTGVNLTCGGLVRIRKGISQLGVIIAHAGIVLLLIAGGVKYEFGVDGLMSLYESEQGREFESPREWELAISSHKTAGALVEFLIPDAAFSHLRAGRTGTFHHGEIPFDVTATRYFPNAVPQPAPAHSAAEAVDGFILQPVASSSEPEHNLPGLYVTLRMKDTASETRGILWGGQRGPLTVDAGDETWTLDLRRKRRQLPFAVRLDAFTRELHPRTTMPKAFVSEVTRIDDGLEQPVRISMNEPLRHKGYTLYQASWGPQDAPPGTPLYSTLAVTFDPAERLPLYACVVITAGLGFHFSLVLYRRLRAEAARTAA